LSLPPGAYQFRASATMAGSGRSGSVYLFTDVPAVKGQPLALSGLALSSSGQPASEPPVIQSSRPAGLTLPFSPSLNRSFTAGDTVDVYFQARRAPASATVNGTVVLIDLADREHALAEWRLNSGDSEVRATLRVPAVAPGGYRLIVRATQGDHQATAGIGVRIE
jgi:hypothetical protein